MIPWAAVIAAGATLAGAYMSSQSANKAADAQTQAAEQSLALQQQMFYQTRSDLSPWTAVGTNALYQLSDALGVSRPMTPLTAANTNLGLVQMPTGGVMGGPTVGSGGGAATGTWGQYSGAMTPGVQAAMAAGGSGQPGGTPGSNFSLGSVARNPGGTFFQNGPVNTFFKSVFGEGNNSQLQDIGGALYQGLPVTDAQWAAAGFGPGGAPLGGSATQTGSAAQPAMTPAKTFQTSPGYQFAFQQGVKAVDAGAATQGLLGSGARLKALTEFGQGIANQEYWNYLNQLGNLATSGQNSAAQTGTFGANYANAAGNIFGAKGNAQAANAVAQGNIWGETIGNLAPLFGNWASGNMGSGYYPWGTSANNAGGGYPAPYTMNWG